MPSLYKPFIVVPPGPQLSNTNNTTYRSTRTSYGFEIKNAVGEWTTRDLTIHHTELFKNETKTILLAVMPAVKWGKKKSMPAASTRHRDVNYYQPCNLQLHDSVHTTISATANRGRERLPHGSTAGYFARRQAVWPRVTSIVVELPLPPLPSTQL